VLIGGTISHDGRYATEKTGFPQFSLQNIKSWACGGDYIVSQQSESLVKGYEKQTDINISCTEFIL